VTQTPYSIVSLFSGAGGFDWGFHLAGFQTRLACELLKPSATTLAKNLGLELIEAPVDPHVNGHRVVVQGDIKQMGYSEVLVEPDVLIGGPPCQDFSTVKAQKREGQEGRRGKLYLEFIKAVMTLQPKFFVFENVPGLLSASGGEVYRIIREDLRLLDEPSRLSEIVKEMHGSVADRNPIGYELVYDGVIDATNLGVPQTRRRLIIVGMRRDLYEEFSDLHQHQIRIDFANVLEGRNSPFRHFPLTAIEVFEGKPLPELQDEYRAVIEAYRDIVTDTRLRSSTARTWREGVWKSLTGNIVEDYCTVNQIRPTLFHSQQFEDAMDEHNRILIEFGWRNKPVSSVQVSDGTNDDPKVNQVVADRMYMIPPDENYQFVDNTEWQVKGKGISFIYRRAFPLKPAWTVVAYGGGGTYGYHYLRERSQLTLRERARIQTFTDSFLFEGPGIRAQIGEAVPPLLGKRIAQQLKRVLDNLSN